MRLIIILLMVWLSFGIAYSWAEDKPSSEASESKVADIIPFKLDYKRQIRVPTPLKFSKPIDAISLLSDKGEIYTLVGLDVPPDEDIEAKAQKRLQDLVTDKKCTLFQTRSEKAGRLNRMGHHLGHIVCGADGAWLQGTLLAEGLARVRTTPDNREQALVMLALEARARTQKIGLWEKQIHASLTPSTAEQSLNRFAVVEGKILSATQNQSSVFLNFERDWKTDFTIGVPSNLRREFSKKRMDLLSLKGKTVRVRGWMRSYNGAYIELDHPEQLEIVVAEKADDTVAGGNKPAVTKIEPVSAEPVPVAKPPKSQFMHTITSPTPPKISKPEPPEELNKKSEEGVSDESAN
jgi:micrococcal nuclease